MSEKVELTHEDIRRIAAVGPSAREAMMELCPEAFRPQWEAVADIHGGEFALLGRTFRVENGKIECWTRPCDPRTP